jgi:hypothetical protein
MLDNPARGGTLGEVKHLSSRGKESNRDSQSSGERNGSSPNLLYVIGYSRCTRGVVGGTFRNLYIAAFYYIVSQRILERTTIEGNSPVGENDIVFCSVYLSKVGHVKSGPNLGRPLSKAK